MPMPVAQFTTGKFTLERVLVQILVEIEATAIEQCNENTAAAPSSCTAGLGKCSFISNRRGDDDDGPRSGSGVNMFASFLRRGRCR